MVQVGPTEQVTSDPVHLVCWREPTFCSFHIFPLALLYFNTTSHNQALLLARYGYDFDFVIFVQQLH